MSREYSLKRIQVAPFDCTHCLLSQLLIRSQEHSRFLKIVRSLGVVSKVVIQCLVAHLLPQLNCRGDVPKAACLEREQ
jgi:hypothetical protein